MNEDKLFVVTSSLDRLAQDPSNCFPHAYILLRLVIYTLTHVRLGMSAVER